MELLFQLPQNWTIILFPMAFQLYVMVFNSGLLRDVEWICNFNGLGSFFQPHLSQFAVFPNILILIYTFRPAIKKKFIWRQNFLKYLHGLVFHFDLWPFALSRNNILHITCKCFFKVRNFFNIYHNFVKNI